MAIQIIRIIDSNSEDGTLTFKNDNHTNNSNHVTKAGRGDRIIWHINRDSGVASITAISAKTDCEDCPDPTDIFLTATQGPSNPGPVGGGSPNWKGETKTDVAIDSEYCYSITWIADDGSGEHIFDPKIILNT